MAHSAEPCDSSLKNLLKNSIYESLNRLATAFRPVASGPAVQRRARAEAKGPRLDYNAVAGSTRSCAVLTLK